jgi:hypothetical protein
VTLTTPQAAIEALRGLKGPSNFLRTAFFFLFQILGFRFLLLRVIVGYECSRSRHLSHFNIYDYFPVRAAAVPAISTTTTGVATVLRSL